MLDDVVFADGERSGGRGKGHCDGQAGFIVVQGWMDCRQAIRDGRICAEFTWEGSDEGDQFSGRGWAALADDGTLSGRIFFHLGDDSGFRATRAEPEQDDTKRATRRRR